MNGMSIAMSIANLILMLYSYRINAIPVFENVG